MGQVVVITGCADGMGRHVAKMLAASGHSVAGFDVDAGGIASLARELKDIGGDHALEAIDITDRPAITAFRDQILPPTVHLNNPDPECDMDYVPNTARKAKVDVCMSNSMGFGGQNDSLIIRRPE